MAILLIEDEPRIRAFITRGLGAEGFTVEEADDGQVGLNRALDDRCDLVILDLGLPSLDGLSVLRALSSRRPRMPVLLLSARTDPLTKRAALSSGACDYLEKPFAFDELLARVRKQLPRGAKTRLETSLR
jgi:DNA-binding response OmpR family regulator